MAVESVPKLELESRRSSVGEMSGAGVRTMRVLGLIDSLGSGGAQRQFVYLMRWLRQEGYEVLVVTYHAKDFFAAELRAAEIPWLVEDGATKAGLIKNIYRRVRAFRPDALISFLDSPNAIAELAGFAARVPVIASERSFDVNGWSSGLFRRLLLHQLARRIVANSHAQAAVLAKFGPWLRSRLRTVPNGVDTGRFQPASVAVVSPPTEIRLVVVASFSRHKNPFNFLAAFAAARQRLPHLNWSVDWFGSRLFRDAGGISDSSCYDVLREQIAANGLTDCFRLHDPVQDVARICQSASAVCLASFYEGCPNVICEAMSCGRPVLASRVSDIPALLRAQPAEWLFVPEKTEDICRAMLAFASASPREREEAGRANRLYAVDHLSLEACGRRFEEILNECCPALSEHRPRGGSRSRS